MKSSLGLIYKTLPLVLFVVICKLIILLPILKGNFNIQIFNIDEIEVVFTGGFFVIGFMLAGTLSDLKESEKIPGELATNLEILKEIILDDDKTIQQDRLILLNQYLKRLIVWLNDKEKHSKDVFSIIDDIHQNLKPRNSNLDQRFFEQLSGLRRIINRTYIIARTTFAQPAYFLQSTIVFISCILVLLCEFNTTSGALFVTFSLTFIFFYLLFLVRELDDPFESLKSKSYVDSKSLEDVQLRVSESINNLK